MDDNNKRHLIEKDFTQLFELNGYEVVYMDYTTGLSASKPWGGSARLSFKSASGAMESVPPTMITTHLYLDSDDPLVTEYDSLIEQKWGGYERPGRTYLGNECESSRGS
ncbi:MAG: hypothetical protein ABJN35_11305 [Erythrobacter sp.]